jgi:hypothetical protein
VVMSNRNESPVFAVTRAGVTLPVTGAFLRVAGSGRVACAMATSRGLSAVKGTGMPQLSTAHVQDQLLGQMAIRNPYTDKTRAAVIGGGARGPHPARDPEPV